MIKNGHEQLINIIKDKNNINITMSSDIIYSLYHEYQNLKQENENLKSIINTAIKYIKEHKDQLGQLDLNKGTSGTYVSCDDELLDILKGTDKNER